MESTYISKNIKKYFNLKKDIKMLVDQPFSFTETLYHSRSDIVIYLNDKIIVPDLVILNCENLQDSLIVKTQRYMLNDEEEIITPILTPQDHLGRNSFCKLIGKKNLNKYTSVH